MMRIQKNSKKSIMSSIRLATATTLGLAMCLAVVSTAPDGLAKGKVRKKKPSPQVKKTAVKKADASKLLKEGQLAYLKGQATEAESKLRACLIQSEKAKNVDVQISCLKLLSEILESKRKLAEAEPFRKKVLELAKQKYGAESGQYAAALAGMSCYFTAKGNNAQSWNYIEQANETLGKAGGSASCPLESSECSIAVARIRALEGSKGLADASFKKALELRESKLKKNAAPVLLVCKEYADLLEKLEDRKDDIKALRDRITVASALGTAGDTAKPADLAKGKASKSGEFAKVVKAAKIAGDAKNYGDALANWKKAAQLAEQSGNKARLAYALVKMGDLYSMQKEKEKQSAMYKRSATIREDINAKDTLGMARVLTRLANIEMVQKNYAEAKRLLSRALIIENAKNAPDAMKDMTLRSLSGACMLTKDLGKGEEVCKQLIALAEKDNSDVGATKKAMATSTLAGIYMQSGRMQEGLSMMKSVSGQINQSASQKYSDAMQVDYKKAEKLVDAAEEKSLGII